MTAEEELRKDQVMIKNVPAEDPLISQTAIYHTIFSLTLFIQIKAMKAYLEAYMHITCVKSFQKEMQV